MGASSVTGISGYGTVAGGQKGSEHMSLSVEKLIGPRVIMADRATLVAGEVRIEFVLPLTAVAQDYVISATQVSASAVGTAPGSAVSVRSFSVTNGNAVLVLKGSGAGAVDVVHFVVYKAGYASAK